MLSGPFSAALPDGRGNPWDSALDGSGFVIIGNPDAEAGCPGLRIVDFLPDPVDSNKEVTTASLKKAKLFSE